LAEGSCGAASGIPTNKAIIKLVSFANGNVAMVVAGWNAIDTRRACTVIADYEKYALAGTEMVVSGTTMSDIKVTTPTVVTPTTTV
jgi:hypothetical protein